MVIETMRRGRSGRALVILALAVLLAPGAAGAQSGLQYESAFDLVWGNGSKGPYSLSRQAVVPGSVTVRLNGNRELLPADYQLDMSRARSPSRSRWMPNRSRGWTMPTIRQSPPSTSSR